MCFELTYFLSLSCPKMNAFLLDKLTKNLRKLINLTHSASILGAQRANQPDANYFQGEPLRTHVLFININIIIRQVSDI